MFFNVPLGHARARSIHLHQHTPTTTSRDGHSRHNSACARVYTIEYMRIYHCRHPPRKARGHARTPTTLYMYTVEAGAHRNEYAHATHTHILYLCLPNPSQTKPTRNHSLLSLSIYFKHTNAHTISSPPTFIHTHAYKTLMVFQLFCSRLEDAGGVV